MAVLLKEADGKSFCKHVGVSKPRTPPWLNRQAGRYMPEYHQVKGDLPSLDFFKNPERAAQATLDAQRILGVDAAIMAADLLPILEPMGLDSNMSSVRVRYSPTLLQRSLANLVTHRQSTPPTSPILCAALSRVFLTTLH